MWDKNEKFWKNDRYSNSYIYSPISFTLQRWKKWLALILGALYLVGLAYYSKKEKD